MMIQFFSYLLLLSDLVLSMKLEGHYKFWDSASSTHVYDYSLNSRHMQFSRCSLNSYYFTDRGLYFQDKCELTLPNNSFNSSPATNDSVFSIWIYLFSSVRILCISDINKSVSDYMLRIYMNPYSTSSFIVNYQRQAQAQTSQTYNTPSSDLYGSRWRFMVFKFNQEGNNTKITIFCNKVEISQYTAEDFYINSPTNKWSMSSTGSIFKGIINELFWHSGVSNVSDMDSIMRSSGFYVPEHSLSLPSYDYTRNSLGTICPDICTTKSLSCDSKLECIKIQETSCLYNLLETSTNHCIFNCPNNSCICLTVQDDITFLKTFTCSCKIDYMKIVENPIACIHSKCTVYTSQGYKHTCTQCQEGYKVECEGDCCVCDIGYVEVIKNPIECTLNIENCIEYIKIEGQWICNTCSVGYKVDPYGRCYNCDSGYSIVSTFPFTCGIEIVECVSYEFSNGEWICNTCSVGYKLGCYTKCCECDTEGGYIVLPEDPTVCTVRIYNCLTYKRYENRLGCSICEAGYLEMPNDHSSCLAEIEGCMNYFYTEPRHLCSECDSKYHLCNNKCCKCESGYYVPKLNPRDCTKCPSHCAECIDNGENAECIACEYGYELTGNSCECGKDFYIEGDTCTVLPLEVSLSPDFNAIFIQFNKYLSYPLTTSDFTLEFLPEFDDRLLNVECIPIIELKEYLISFALNINVSEEFSVIFTFSDTILDRQKSGLSNKIQYTTLNLKIEEITQRSELCDTSCKECSILNGKIDCSACYDYAYKEDALCICFYQESSTRSDKCKAECPQGMSIDLQLKTCLPCPNCIANQIQVDQNISEDSQIAERYADISSSASAAFVYSAVALGSILSSDTMWNLINSVQIYTYLPLLQVNMPLNLQKSLKAQDSSSKYFNALTPRITGSKPFAKAVDFGYETSNLILNAIKPLLILAGIILLNIIAYTIHRYSRGKLKHYSGIALNALYLKIYLRFLIQSYLDILIPAFLQVIYVMIIQPNEDDIMQIMIYVFSLLVCILLVLSPYILLCFIIVNFKRIDQEATKKVWGTFFDEFKTSNSKVRFIYYVLFFVRRLGIAGSMILLANHPLIQVCASITYCWIV